MKNDILAAIKDMSAEVPKEVDLLGLRDQILSLMNESSKLNTSLKVLESLCFPAIKSRHANIAVPHASTYDWIFEDTDIRQVRDSASPRFVQWLRSQEAIYWINGKAGSGKSTLMKFISGHARTMKNLRVWAADHELVTASYYFWKSGTDMQKSLEGLFRSLLYNILQQCPILASSLQGLRSIRSATAHAWSLSDLSDIFSQLRALEFSTNFCFFIDGLDEYDGFHPDVVNVIASLALSSNIKICLSSRPWNVFEDAYGEDTYPSLRLRDLTNSDIAVYVEDNLEKDRQFATLRIEHKGYENLVLEIVAKAQGVFLWVFLVVRSLLRGLTDYDTIADLRRRLALLPEDLDKYFEHMLDSTEKVYHQQAAQMLQTCLASRHPPSLLSLSFYDEQDLEFSLRLEVKPWTHKNIKDINRATRKRVNARCVDLVVITTEAQNYLGAVQYKIEFLHRTVRDFLETKKIQTLLAERQGTDFDADVYLCHAYLAQMKYRPRVNIIPWKGFFYHAFRAECKLQNPQISVLEEFDRVKASHREDLSRNVPAALDLQFGPDRAFHQRLWFLGTCVREGLVFYVKSQLELSDPLFETIHINWLLGVAMTTFSWNSTSNEMTPAEVRFWENQFSMLRLLMAYGANPNHKVMGKFLWDHVSSSLQLGLMFPSGYILARYVETLLSKGMTSATEDMVKDAIGYCREEDRSRLHALYFLQEQQQTATPGSKRYYDSNEDDDNPRLQMTQGREHFHWIPKRPRLS